MPEVAEETMQLCKDIVRISDGGTSVTFGDLMKDEVAEQYYEALFGTLKAARKRGLVEFKGDILLQGQHDGVVISLTDTGRDKAAADPTSAGPTAAEPAAEMAPDAKELTGADEFPATVNSTAAEPPEAPSNDDSVGKSPSDSGKDGKKWSVDTSYIDWRTADPNRLEPRRTNTENTEGALTTTSVSQKEDGKWKQVNTSYIDWRTSDPNRLEPRRSSTMEIADPPMVPTVSKKSVDGKWEQVDASYINYRTGDCDRLDGRRSIAKAPTSTDLADASATVKKEGDGKWKVDTSYIGYRTADPNNLDRKLEKNNEPVYANPAEKKYPYEELKAAISERPADVDPSMKEQYLSEAEFQTVFGVSFADFAKMPKWKAQNLKKAKDLF